MGIDVLKGYFCSALKCPTAPKPHAFSRISRNVDKKYFFKKIILLFLVSLLLMDYWLTKRVVFGAGGEILFFTSTQLHIWSSCLRPSTPCTHFSLPAQCVSLDWKITVETGQGLSTQEGRLNACAADFLSSELTSRCADRRI